jgi:hypothetical protein
MDQVRAAPRIIELDTERVPPISPWQPPKIRTHCMWKRWNATWCVKRSCCFLWNSERLSFCGNMKNFLIKKSRNSWIVLPARSCHAWPERGPNSGPYFLLHAMAAPFFDNFRVCLLLNARVKEATCVDRDDCLGRTLLLISWLRSLAASAERYWRTLCFRFHSCRCPGMCNSLVGSSDQVQVIPKALQRDGFEQLLQRAESSRHRRSAKGACARA